MQLYTRHVSTFKTVSAFIPSTLKTCFHPLQQFIAQIVPSFIDSIILMLVYRLIEKRLIFQGPHNTKHLSPASQLLNSSLLLLCIVCSAAPSSDSPSFIIRSHQTIVFARPHTNTHTCLPMHDPLGFVTYTPPCFSLLMAPPPPHSPRLSCRSPLLVLVLPRRLLGPCWGAGNCRGPW